jgi:hypothetical protein
MPEYFATLIGIDGYPPQCDPLAGCVRDVEGMTTYLKENSGIPRFRIESLKARTMEPREPLQGRKDHFELPTYVNIKSSLEKWTSMASSGDYIYIHFSGHGTTIPATKDLPDVATEDFALVVLEPKSDFGIRYFHGIEIARLIQAMVLKGVLVTLVLDCCFSGAVARHDSRTRGLRYNTGVDAAYPLQLEQSKGSDEAANLLGVTRHVYRGATMRQNWLINPDGYTILTACGPAEKSKELIDKNGNKHGILSYFLLMALKRLGSLRRRHCYLYSHICSLFVSTRATRQNEQNPMLYGNKDLSIFGMSEVDRKHNPIGIVKSPDGNLSLEAGEAQCVVSGDRFLVCPLDVPQSALDSRTGLPIARATQVKGLTSELEVLESANANIRTGWIAFPITRLALRQFPIRFNLPPPWRDRLHTATKARQSLSLSNSDAEPASFHVTSNTGHECEVRNGVNEVIINLGIVLDLSKEIEDDLLDILEHLCMFRLVKALTNSSPSHEHQSLRDTFSVHIQDAAGKRFSCSCQKTGPFQPGCDHEEFKLQVLDGEKITLVVEDYSRVKDQALYIYLYGLGDEWGIENLLHSNHEVVQQSSESVKRIWKKKLKMTVTAKQRAGGKTECHDTLKLFLSRRPTSFLSLEIGELGKLSVCPKRPVSACRGAQHSSEQWEAVNFHIHTRLRDQDSID